MEYAAKRKQLRTNGPTPCWCCKGECEQVTVEDRVSDTVLKLGFDLGGEIEATLRQTIQAAENAALERAATTAAVFYSHECAKRIRELKHQDA